MIKLKVGRDMIDIDENDLILDNGACYQIVTKMTCSGWYQYPRIMSKKLFKDLKKLDLVFTNEELHQLAVSKYDSETLTFWKFHIDRMQELGY